MKDKIKEILVDVYQIDGRLEDEAAERISKLFINDDKSIADLNHITINSAMNIQALTENERIIEECIKIIAAIRDFSKTVNNENISSSSNKNNFLEDLIKRAKELGYTVTTIK